MAKRKVLVDSDEEEEEDQRSQKKVSA